MRPQQGDTVFWDTVKGVVKGTLLKEQEDNDWIVLLDSGKHVIVNESSFKPYDERR